jgi:hypothetical protein
LGARQTLLPQVSAEEENTMSRPVSRGAFGVERAGAARLKPMAAEEVALNFAKVVNQTVDTYQLKERRALMKHLVHGEADIHGRRLYTDAARSDARLLIRLINARLRGVTLTLLQESHVIASSRRVFEALETGML